MLQLSRGGSHVKVKLFIASCFYVNSYMSGNVQNLVLIVVAVVEVEAEGEVETEDVAEVVEEEEEI